MRVLYTKVPINQAHSVRFDGEVSNVGISNETNAHVVGTVFDNASIQNFQNAGSGVPLSVGDMIDGQAMGWQQPNVTGYYKVEIRSDYTNSLSDATPENNYSENWMEMTQSIYARDYDYAEHTTFDNGGGAYESGNVFFMHQTATLNRVWVKLGENSDVGAIVYVSVYEIDPVTGAFNLAYSSSGTANEHTVTANNLGAWVPLSASANLSANTSYIICTGAYGGSNDVEIEMDYLVEPQSAFLLDGIDNTWYYFLNAPKIRADFGTGLSGFISREEGIGCDSACNGALKTNVTEGTPPYSYQWYDGTGAAISGQTSASITGLCAGQYSVQVTDAANATVTFRHILEQYKPISGAGLITHVNQGNDGEIDFIAHHGYPPFSYAWSNGDTTQDISNLDTGYYTVTVTDFMGCTYLQTFYVSGSLGIYETTNQPFELFPNPAKDILVIDIEKNVNESLEMCIYTLDGRCVQKGFIDGNTKTEVSLNHLPAGTYMVRLSGTRYAGTQKLIIVE